MKLFIISLFAGIFLTVQASTKPGGYILKGGVDHRILGEKPAGHYRDAQQAGRYAQQKRLEEEIQSEAVGFEFRNTKRQVAQNPTFFTSHDNHAALTALAHDNRQPQQFHQKREVYQSPLYYNEYHNKK